MSTYGSRVETFYPIFKRVQKLIEKGALSYEERPVWFDVYKHFPPKVEPNYHRPVPVDEVREILYQEDIDRAYELLFLGTASGYPSPHRGASGIVLRDLELGDYWLFDCGEGTQIQAQKSSHVRIKSISHIFITHLHGDHIYGLPGLLCTIDQKEPIGFCDSGFSNSSAQAAVNIYGPQGLRRFIRLALALSRSNLKYTYAVHELILRDEHRPSGWKDWCSLVADPAADPPLHFELPGRDIVASDDGFWYNVTSANENSTLVHAVPLRHTIPSVGWVILKPTRPPPLQVDKAHALGVPSGPLMGELKRGNPVCVNGRTINPQDVLGPPLRGHRIAIMGDSYDSTALVSLISGLHSRGHISSTLLDVLVHEATLEDNMAAEARQKGHSTPAQVTQLAAQLSVRLLILTHFSQRYSKMDEHNVNGKKNERTSVQLILEQAKNSSFTGDVVLAEDFALIPVPHVPKDEIVER